MSFDLDDDEYRATRILTGADKPHELKVGEYGRTNLGNIIKFAWIEYEAGRIDEDKVILIDLMKTKTRPFYYFKKGEHIVKHSPNIIDLIEVDDYVNGHKIVREIWGEDDNDLHFEIEGGFGKATYIGEKNIKSIATKEQFKSVEYKIGGE